MQTLFLLIFTVVVLIAAFVVRLPRFRPFVALHRVALFRASLAFAAFAVGFLITGCAAPTWLTDAGSIIALVGASFASIASFIAGLTGNTALAALLETVSKWITTVQTGVADLQALITQYKASPTTGLLAEIEAALADLKSNVEQDFSNLGLPASVLSVIADIAGEAASLLAAWDLAIQGVKTAASTHELHAAVSRMTTLADGLPEQIATYKANVNLILTTPTGDPETDAALSKVSKL